MNMHSIKGYLIVFTIIFTISSLFVVNGSGWKKRLEENQKQEMIYKHQLDSLNRVIELKEEEIEKLEEACEFKEAEISFWGRKYDESINGPIAQ